MRIIIKGELPDLNTYTDANRAHYRKGAKLKKEATELVAWQVKGRKKVEGAYTLSLHWTFPNKKKDPDNIIFAKKFILDGLQTAGIVKNDSCRYFKGIDYETWEFGDEAQVEVIIADI
jgi:Holliday junction resolvase RusA-like endonuclease